MVVIHRTLELDPEPDEIVGDTRPECAEALFVADSNNLGRGHCDG